MTSPYSLFFCPFHSTLVSTVWLLLTDQPNLLLITTWSCLRAPWLFLQVYPSQWLTLQPFHLLFAKCSVSSIHAGHWRSWTWVVLRVIQLSFAIYPFRLLTLQLLHLSYPWCSIWWMQVEDRLTKFFRAPRLSLQVYPSLWLALQTFHLLFVKCSVSSIHAKHWHFMTLATLRVIGLFFLVYPCQWPISRLLHLPSTKYSIW